MAKKEGIVDIPIPPLPKFLLDKSDPEYAEPVAAKPEDLRARLQLDASIALDVLEWHARNLADAKASHAACCEILDRAGFQAPAKPKAGEVAAPVAGGGELLPPIEDAVRSLSSAFESIQVAPQTAEDEREE